MTPDDNPEITKLKNRKWQTTKTTKVKTTDGSKLTITERDTMD